MFHAQILDTAEVSPVATPCRSTPWALTDMSVGQVPLIGPADVRILRVISKRFTLVTLVKLVLISRPELDCSLKLEIPFWDTLLRKFSADHAQIRDVTSRRLCFESEHDKGHISLSL